MTELETAEAKLERLRKGWDTENTKLNNYSENLRNVLRDVSTKTFAEIESALNCARPLLTQCQEANTHRHQIEDDIKKLEDVEIPRLMKLIEA
jgi:hypothetical protein